MRGPIIRGSARSQGAPWTAEARCLAAGREGEDLRKEEVRSGRKSDRWNGGKDRGLTSFSTYLGELHRAKKRGIP